MKTAMAASVLRGGSICRELWPADLRSDRVVGLDRDGGRGTGGVGISPIQNTMPDGYMEGERELQSNIRNTI
jgi:hypothetical protein